MQTLCGALGALAVLKSQPLFACAACYGQSDSPLAQGMNWGIVSLLGVISCVLGAVVVFFVHVGRKSATVDLADDATKPLPGEH